MSSNVTDQSPHLAIVGCTGAVGRELLAILAERGHDASRLTLLASARSAGTTVDYRGESLPVRELTESSFGGIDLALFSAGGGISRGFAPHAVQAGATVIDNSSAFRMDEGVPLVVPEVNGHVLDRHGAQGRFPGVIANPNCTTIIALMAIAPLHRATSTSGGGGGGGGGIERMVVSTYQAVSGGGATMMDELDDQAKAYDGADLPEPSGGRRMLFNIFNHDSAIDPATGANEEETKLVRETHKILGDDSIGITSTCVRVPVLRAHSEAINLTFRNSMTEDEAREILASAPGIRIVDDRAANRFPEPLDASGIDDVLVGRLRADHSQPAGKGLNLFVSGDQLRKGAALNAIQIAEQMIARQRIHV